MLYNLYKTRSAGLRIKIYVAAYYQDFKIGESRVNKKYVRS